MACNICNDIASLLPGGPHNKHEAVLGTVEDVVHKSPCNVHPPLLIEALNIDSSVAVAELIVARKSAVYGEIYFDGIRDDSPLGSFGWQRLDTEGTHNRIKLVNDQWIDIDRIRTWRDRCKSEHGVHCDGSDFVSFSSLRPAWLVDCVEKRLVYGDVSGRYVALSYVWGQAQRFKLGKAMLKDLRQAGALSAPEIVSMLPIGIRDVQSLMLVLKERYLWVDCLCIAQDDEHVKQQEILKMAGIYYNASFTIVLASALDKSSKGLQGVSGPRTLGQNTYKLTEEHTLVQHLSMRKDHRTDPWSNRAWTFQENLFSQRILEFQKGIVFWRCQRTEWHEDEEDNEEDSEEDEDNEPDRAWEDNLQQTLHHGYPSFPSIAELITKYNTRDLTYAEDAHTAFSSILTIVSRFYKGGFISGLPATNFDLALLWLPESPMTLRAGEQYAGSVLPTWSWIAWQGRLNVTCWYKGYDHIVMTGKHLEASERVLPLVHWSIPEKNSATSRSLQNEWLSLRKRYMAEDVSPPEGWTRHAFDAFDMDLYYMRGEENPYLFDGTDDDFLSLNRPEMEDNHRSLPRRCYTHESIPGTKFWYPIPLPDQDEDPPEPVVVPHVCCQTRLARLYGAERLPNERNDHGAITLRDNSGKFAGVLRPNQWSPILTKRDPTTRSRHNLTGTCFDLVELPVGYCYEDYVYPRNEPNIDEYRHPERPRRWDQRYEFYNVMWVTWRDGIAYRRGIGRAVKDVWESLEREHISLTLG